MKEIKFKDGRQLLIEYDAGHISPKQNEKILSEIKNMDFSEDLILYAVLQKYDTPNKNGRIYPESVLKREIDKYQSVIKMGSALSELNHPSCHTGDVNILTLNGWKNIKEIDEEEYVYTLSNESVIEIKQIYSKVKHKFNGKMVHLKGRNIDTIVTPNHKFPIINRNNNKLKFITAEEILKSFKNGNKLSHYYIPKISKIDDKNVDFFTLSGKSGNIRKEYRKFDRYISENNGTKRLIKGENSNDMWFLTFSKTKGIYLDNRNLTVTEENFDDYVYSIDVPNHTYYIKSNEKCHWTGNSSLIDLDRVSHSLLETWWEGKILMGKIKLLTSPGWKKMGIVSTKGDQAAMLLLNGATLGISSRGVGSLSNVKGQNIVQDDFSLVGFDIVSSPSTPGGYIFSDPSERSQYEESIEDNNKKTNNIKNLMDKLDNFLQK